VCVAPAEELLQVTTDRVNRDAEMLGEPHSGDEPDSESEAQLPKHLPEIGRIR
jgi:hypothetical protein